MPTINSIHIENFKGINDVLLEFGKKGAPPVTTLIGLNESGKTTILEALSHFVTGDSAVSSLFDGVHSKSEIASLIPVSKKANFSGRISISANIELDDEDVKDIKALISKSGYEVEDGSIPKVLKISRSYTYEDSASSGSKNYWWFAFKARKGRSKKFTTYDDRRKDEEFDLWSTVIRHIQERLPRIAYFPTFLVDMPKKIYLAEHQGETATNKYYRVVFQDILDSLNEDLSLQKHVVDRIVAYKDESDNPGWFSAFWGSANKAPIDSVFSKISATVTRQVLGSWQKIFQRKISAKNILVEWGVDTDKSDLPYATFSIFDGESRYFVSERSLGFRWFFSFLLFTAFKQKKKRPTLFVFDEPAANLHAKAQSELLKSFSRTVDGGDSIVYSTHSHHMINPSWISGAYIVENKAIDYDSDEDTFGLNSKPTDIVVTPYRRFVSQYPNRTSYFQPVVDMLEYVTPEIVGESPFLLVEGITDYFALRLAVAMREKSCSFSIMPGVGSGACDPQIGLLLARGDKFLVLLDDDKAGRTNALRYRENWYLSDNQVLTLADVDAAFSGTRLEGILSDETLDIVAAHFEIAGKPSKKQIGLYLSEMSSIQSKASLSVETCDRFCRIIDLVESKLQA